MKKENEAIRDAASRRKSRRYHPGMIALREIKKQQKSTGLLLKKSPFKRTVRELFHDYKSGLMFAADGPELALQEVAESLLVKLASDSQLCSVHAGRVTVLKRDMELARSILQRNNYRA